MAATRQLPEGYTPLWSLDLSKNLKAVIALNIAGIPLLLASFWFFGATARFLRPELPGQVTSLHSVGLVLLRPLLLLVSSVLMVVLHEAIHGMFFWLFTNEKPVFGFKWLYAYAGAPHFFIPRNQYLIVGLAPFVIISCAGILFQSVIPLSLLFTLNFTLVINAAGAVGDLYVVLKLLTFPPSTHINDTGDKFTAYGESSSEEGATRQPSP